MATVGLKFARKILAFGVLAGLLAGCAVYAAPPRPVAYYGPAYYAGPAVHGYYYWR